MRRKLQSNPFCGFLESTCIRSNAENYFRIVTTGLTFSFSGPIICDNDDEKKEEHDDDDDDDDDDDGWL